MFGRLVIGKEYPAVLNGIVRHFTVLDYDPSDDWYGVRWDDGDEENLFFEDIERLVDNYYLYI
ncbi:tudor domain-containing protein [Lacrimispora brassicae]